MTDGLEPFAAALHRALAQRDPIAALHGAGLTDGLPVVLPGTEAVEALLGRRDPAAPATANPLPIAFATPTWFDLAACAVLAGCPAEPPLLDVIAAAVDACADPAFNLLGVATTTGAASPLVVVHGGTAERLGFNAGAGTLGPGGPRNASVGRAVRLALQNIGCARPGEGDMATLGHPGKIGWLAAERLGASPWAPLEPGEAVTVFPGVGSVEVVLPTTSADAVADRLAAVLGGLASPGALVLVPPDAAVFLARHGWDAAALGAALAEHCPTPIRTVVCGGAGVKAAVVLRWGGPCDAITRPVAIARTGPADGR